MIRLKNEDPKGKCKFVIISQNIQGYTSYLLLYELVKEAMNRTQIVNGVKLLCLELLQLGCKCIGVYSLDFPDASRCLNQSLWAFRRRKGIFNHFPNRSKNWQAYVEPLPCKNFTIRMEQVENDGGVSRWSSRDLRV